ncbi:conserved hypothetical protein [Theileria orientalis strain Shintoku]|uniref:Uncharacterized protein n=1 Tax=Theileria orientalis strain Shintoku TaxID=869250 RepID=J4C9B1_THEOR|nr:conserved hypothetical protein [Theileria orientalis strain Shintoku]BAM42228.1 conserved hypothetical protein [Theileria orientalis strain Shintoku]|eukprot:XP_009692529.1 conserved hypothetical protein [Theileria orientalis strain Shintoku]
MKTLFAVIFAVASVYALVADLTETDTHAKLAVFHHVGHTDGTGANAATLRFAHLVPKADHLGHFDEGVGCHHAGGAVKHHQFVHVEAGEKLVELLGVSDCKKWHAVVLGVFSDGYLFHKHYAFHKDHHTKPAVLDGALALADFVHTHVDLAHAKVFGELVKKGLTAHLFTHLLHAKLASRLALV